MGLGKNFRLPVEVRPVRYRAHLAPDLEKGSFEGRLELQLKLATPRRDLTLHAIDLSVDRARARAAGKTIRATAVEPDAESQTVTLRFEDELPPGEALVDLAWTGKFSPGLRGLYRAGPVAVTQFEAADARRVFPCFDEPSFKARWEIHLLEVPPGAAAISNGAVVKDEAGDGGRRTVQFAETPPLSSYLVAFCAGKLTASDPVTVRGIPIRTWAVPEKKALTAFAQECAAAVLPLLEDYFGQPYAYGKLDQIGVPDFEAGAMENAGAITFREVALLLDPRTAPINVQKRVAEVITHELAHQWFGNLVTMVWWDDLWLNEAFATWMAYKIVDRWRPGWRVWMDFEVGKGAALHLDALQSSHAIRAEVKNAEEAGESFDAITYEKGGAILRMIEAWLAEERFREGIRLYMRRHKEGNATADDLWGALAESSGEPILELANGWIRQVGYPVLSVARRDGQLVLRQRRFFSDPAAREKGAPTRWLVPVVLRTGGARGGGERRVLLRDEQQEAPLDPGASWVLANASGRGFYRVQYEPDLLHALVQALPELLSEERMNLVSDQWALVRSGAADPAGFFELLEGVARTETDHVVLDEVVGRLSWLEHRGVSDADRPLLHAWVRDLFAAHKDELGWEGKPGEDDDRRLRRAAVLRALALVARDPATLDEARRRYDDQAGLDPNLLDIVVPATARGADRATFAQMRRRAAEEIDPAVKRRFLLALGVVESPDLVPDAVDLSLRDDVKMQDFALYVAALLGNRAARDLAWELIRSRWDEVRKKGDSPMLLRRLVESLGALPERRHLEEVDRFLADHPLEGARQAIAQTLERMRMDVALRERLVPAVGAFLRRRS